MSNELSVVEQADRLLPSVQVLESLKTQAQALVDAHMLPPGYRTGAEALVVALKAREMGVHPMRGWQGMFPVTREEHSRIGFMGNFILGLIYERLPEAEIITEENTTTLCKIKARRNKTSDFQYFTVTMAEAKASKWDTYYDKDAKAWKAKATWSDPANMLYWRTVTRMANRLFGDITGGAAYTKDEIEDIPDGSEYIPPAEQAAESVPYQAGVVEAVTEPKTEPDPAKVDDNMIQDLKVSLLLCSSASAVEDVWKKFKCSTTNGKLLNEGLALKNARKAEVSHV